MNRQSLTFIVTFLVTAGAVGPFVLAGQPVYGLAAGLVGLVLHWVLSRGGDRDGEVADSSYFFGFLLTLVFLALGLYRIGAAPDAGGTQDILGFLDDLAAGLALTIAGLLIRQARALAGARTTTEESSVVDVQRQLAENLKAMIELWRARPEHQVVDMLEQSRSVAREAAAQLDRNIAAAGNRMLESVERLDQATATSTQAITRAASNVGASLSSLAERLEVDIVNVVGGVQKSVADVLTIIEQQRTAADEALTQAQSHHREQLELWRSTLDQAKASLGEAQRSLDEEYRRGMEGFAASGTAFARLTEQATSQVEALPNPAERLAGLWDGIRQLETDLTEAIAGSVMELGTLRERSEQLRQSFEQLGGSTDRAATMIGTGSERLGGSLQRELDQMNGIIEEYVTLLERTTRQLKVRA
ncbi:MAG TPA: hypothetical protein VHG09_14795 [Longimicrobiales bacterium]|nr:hypothetical protein [Longimicrobiales bacterium]